VSHSKAMKRRRLKVRMDFEKRDAWIGLYWTGGQGSTDLSDGWEWRVLHVYVCLIPFLPLHVTYSWRRPWATDAATGGVYR
jgi:hypothetical protein